MHPGQLEKTPERKLLALQPQGRWLAEAAGHHHRDWRVFLRELPMEEANALVRRDRGDALPCERLDATETLAHTDAGPDRPLDAQAPAMSMLGPPARRQVCQPLVRQRVVG